MADLLEGKVKKPKSGSLGKWNRDVELAYLVETVSERTGLTPSRNEVSAGLSAMDAVAEVVDLSFKSVERAYLRARAARKRHMDLRSQ